MPDAVPFDPTTGLPPGKQLDPVLEISPVAAKAALHGGGVTLIDCREPHEHQMTRIDGGELVPLSTMDVPKLTALADRLRAEGRPVIVYCRVGGRSLGLTAELSKLGVPDVRSMAGGINAWNTAVEPGGLTY